MKRIGSIDRLWMIGGGQVAIALLAIGWFFFIGPQLDQAKGLRGQAAEARQHKSSRSIGWRYPPWRARRTFCASSRRSASGPGW
jgi:hypothetical protein